MTDRQFSRRAVMLAAESEHGARLVENAVESVRLAREISDLRKMGDRECADKLQRLEELREERGGIIQTFQDTLDAPPETLSEDNRITVDLGKVLDRFESLGYDVGKPRAILEGWLLGKNAKNEKITAAVSLAGSQK